MNTPGKLAFPDVPSAATTDSQNKAEDERVILQQAINEAYAARTQADAARKEAEAQRKAYQRAILAFRNEQNVLRSAVHAQITGLQNLLVLLNGDVSQFSLVTFEPFIEVAKPQTPAGAVPGARQQEKPVQDPEDQAVGIQLRTLQHHLSPVQQLKQLHQHQEQQHARPQSQTQLQLQQHQQPSQQQQQHPVQPTQHQFAPAAALQSPPSQQTSKTQTSKAKAKQAANKVDSPIQEALKRKAQSDLARMLVVVKRQQLQQEEGQHAMEERVVRQARKVQDASSLEQLLANADLTPLEKFAAMPEGTVEMRRDLTTVAEVWQEWHYGLNGGMSVLDMDRHFGDYWRPRTNKGGHQKLYCSRRLIIEEMMVKAEDMGCEPEEMVQMTDTWLDKMTLQELYKSIFDEIRETQIRRLGRPVVPNDNEVNAVGKLDSRIGNVDLVRDQRTRFEWIRSRGF